MNKIIISHRGCEILETSLVKSLFFFPEKERHRQRKMAREKLISEGQEVVYMLKMLISWLQSPLQRTRSQNIPGMSRICSGKRVPSSFH